MNIIKGIFYLLKCKDLKIRTKVAMVIIGITEIVINAPVDLLKIIFELLEKLVDFILNLLYQIPTFAIPFKKKNEILHIFKNYYEKQNKPREMELDKDILENWNNYKK